MIWGLPVHQSRPLVLESGSSIIRAIGPPRIIVIAWIHSTAVRSRRLSLRLNLILVGKLLLPRLIRDVEWLSLPMRLPVRIGWVKWDSLTILTVQILYLTGAICYVGICLIRNDSCNCISIFETSADVRGIWSSSIISGSGERLSPHDATHDCSFCLIWHILIIVLALSSSFWRI